ncbi:uncharacterized protein LOC128213509 isoform X2 [Mya arenaria]|nr:uncharacterized protein LOC128213509 isoform X2 [Mya arenaria]XP_052775234.1 uncharacterized protein LOC128213509 isoform X2 [Mya arenaria]XP_052775235.1 uncharacterized protein LOC128213509 isoform X2 [Mya arenaria]
MPGLLHRLLGIVVVAMYNETGTGLYGEGNLLAVPRETRAVDMSLNDEIKYVIDHKMSACHAPKCQKCFTIAPDPVNPTSNDKPMRCPKNKSCVESYSYRDLESNYTRGQKIECNGIVGVTVDCCLLRAAIPNGYCKNGGKPVCEVKAATAEGGQRWKKPKCACKPLWTGTTCTTSRETKILCSCYSGYHEFNGQRSLPHCQDLQKQENWTVCHMTLNDMFSCICNKTESTNRNSKEDASNATLGCNEVYHGMVMSTEANFSTLVPEAEIMSSPINSLSSIILPSNRIMYFSTIAMATVYINTG